MPALLVIFAAGCAGPDRDAVLASIRQGGAGGAGGVYLADVPFYPQKRLMCGPAALASVLGYYGVDTTPGEVERAVYEPGLKGSLTMDMLLFAKEKGLRAVFYEGGLDDLKERLGRDGTPLILFLNLGNDFYPVWHYVVAVGYSDGHGAVIAHWGSERDKAVSYERLLRDWAKTGFSTLLVTPAAGEGR